VLYQQTALRNFWTKGRKAEITLSYRSQPNIERRRYKFTLKKLFQQYSCCF